MIDKKSEFQRRNLILQFQLNSEGKIWRMRKTRTKKMLPILKLSMMTALYTLS